MNAHHRDGSLIRKKQDQWARERAEEPANIWFPFGSPGGGTPNRKYESIDYTVPAKTQQKASLSQGALSEFRSNDVTLSKSTSQTQTSDAAKIVNEARKQSVGQSDCPHCPTSLPSQPLSSQQHLPFHSRPNTCPFQVPTSSFSNAPGAMPVSWSYLQPIPVSFVPPGTVPIPIQDLKISIAEGTPICPVSVAEQFAQINTSNLCWGPITPNSVPVAIPIPPPVTVQGAPVDPCQEPSESVEVPPSQRHTHEVYDCSPSTSDAVTRAPPQNTTVSKYHRDQRSLSVDYGEQIAEKRRMEAEEAERDRCEEEKVMREKEEQIRREEEEKRKRMEAEHLRQQEKERVRRALEEALERAKHEAEVTRKAKVFKHVLEGAEKSPELEKRLLGVDHETGDRILHEITQLELHKKLDREVIDKKSPKVDGSGKHEKSPNDRRSQSAQSKLRQLSNSEPEVTPVVRSGTGKTPLNRRRTTCIHPLATVNDHISKHADEFTGMHQTPSSNNSSTPFRRTAIGRASMRVTRKEKENDSMQPTNTSPDCFISSLMRERRAPPSRIPIAKNLSRAAVCSSRPPALPSRPLKSVNHQPTVEAEAARLIKSLPEDIPSPRQLVRPGELSDNPLFNPVITRHRRPNRMRGTTNSPVSVDSVESSAGSTEGSSGSSSNSESTSPHAASTSPVPSIVISHDQFTVTKSIPTLNNNELKIRSAVISPAAYLNQTPQSTSRFAKKLAEKGCNKHIEDILAPEVRRKAEANISRTSSVQSLRGSLGNLAGWRGSVSNLTEDSPCLNQFRSTNSKYRSFNTKKTTAEKQQEVIDRLRRLRESLRSKENFVDRESQENQNEATTRITSTVVVSNS